MNVGGDGGGGAQTILLVLQTLRAYDQSMPHQESTASTQPSYNGNNINGNKSNTNISGNRETSSPRPPVNRKNWRDGKLQTCPHPKNRRSCLLKSSDNCRNGQRRCRSRQKRCSKKSYHKSRWRRKTVTKTPAILTTTGQAATCHRDRGGSNASTFCLIIKVEKGWRGSHTE